MMDPQSLQAKQQYLHREILQQQYDPEEFQQFMANEKGLDLDDYSMKELIKVVQRFKGVLLEDQSEEKILEQSPKTHEETIQFRQNLQDEKKDQNSPLEENKKIIQAQKTKVQKQKTQKVKIDLKKMIIPQFKPKDQKPQQTTSQNSPTKSQPLFESSKTQQKPIPQQKINPISTKLVRKSFYNEDEDEQKSPYDQAFIGGMDDKAGTSFTQFNDTDKYRQSMKQSVYIPSEGNKNPYIIVKKSNYSSLYKEIKSSVMQNKDGKKVNTFFEGFSIKIRQFSKKQSNSIFRFPYVTYNIETTFPVSKQTAIKSTKSSFVSSSTNKVWRVERRFNDFKWLHDFLQKSYYGLPIPPIPQKTKMRSFNDEHLTQRMNVFERFLIKCSHIDQICSDPIFQAFLSIEARQELEAVKKKYEDKIKSRDQNLMQFIKGEQILIHSKEQSQISANTKNFLTKETQLLEILNRELQNVQKNMKLASQHAVFASNIFRQLSQLYKANHEYEIQGSSLFDLTSEYISELSYKLDNEAYHLKNYVTDLWTYEELYNKNLIYRTQSLDRHKTILETKFKEFHTTKNNQLSQDPTTSNTKGPTLYKKTRQLYEINLSLCIEEITRHLKEDLLLTAKQFLKGMEKHVGQVKQEMMTGVDLMTKIMTVAEGKQLKQVQLIGMGMKDRQNNDLIKIRQV